LVVLQRTVKGPLGSSRPVRETSSVTWAPSPSCVQYSVGTNSNVPPSPSSKMVSVVWSSAPICSVDTVCPSYRGSLSKKTTLSSGYSNMVSSRICATTVCDTWPSPNESVADSDA